MTRRTMKRWHFLVQAGGGLLAGWARAQGPSGHRARGRRGSQITKASSTDSNTVTLFLGGDVMTGRGIDQISPHPSQPDFFEPYVRSAVEYAELAERTSGRIASPVAFDYVWGDALDGLDRVRPNARIVNLETAVMTSDDA
jgi:hypothetical protein